MIKGFGLLAAIMAVSYNVHAQSRFHRRNSYDAFGHVFNADMRGELVTDETAPTGRYTHLDERDLSTFGVWLFEAFAGLDAEPVTERLVYKLPEPIPNPVPDEPPYTYYVVSVELSVIA